MTARYESCLAVADYDDFQECGDALADAMKAARIDLIELGFKEFQVIDAEFIEFDSANPSHAGAYFDVTVDGIEQAELEAAVEGAQ